jgi:hypothetical protein
MADNSTRERDEAATYEVGLTSRTSAPGDARSAGDGGDPRDPIAILVAHGMGQQIQFQTLDDVAEGLCRFAKRGRRAPRAETVEVSGQRLQRLDLLLTLENGAEREVHVYEAYWAPLTEGRVTLRDVIAFLVFGAFAGIRAGRKPFHRWLFQRYARFPAPIRTVVYLELALAIVASLTLLDVVILAVAAVRVPLHDTPHWADSAFIHDVTTVLNLLLVALAPLVVVLLIAARRRRKKQQPLVGGLSLVTFVVALWSTLAAGLLVAAIVLYHANGGVPASLFEALHLDEDARRFDAAFGNVAMWLLVVGGIGWLLRRLWTTHGEFDRALPHNQNTRALTESVRVGYYAIIATLLAVAVGVLRPIAFIAIAAQTRAALAWPIVVGVTLLVRSFLIEFAGDVAAYVQPQRLDKFFELRQRIKETVVRTARAVYADERYKNIILVGHSLGSVVTYDALNRLILDENLVGQPARVVERTKLFLTFGSPLDKTAFIFGIQGVGSEAREALAASVQPMLTDPRPTWINIWSPWDIVSGALDYYDLPKKTNPNPVDNKIDPMATTLLAAHVEYWNNPLLYRTILNHLI